MCIILLKGNDITNSSQYTVPDISGHRNKKENSLAGLFIISHRI